jgi:hypothetical protein
VSISQLQRAGKRSAYAKQFVMFSSQVNKNTNIVYRSIVGWRKGDISFGEMVKGVTMPTIMNALYLAAVRWGYKALKSWWRGEDEPDIENFLMDVASRLAGLLLIGGTTVAAAVDAVQRKWRGKKAGGALWRVKRGLPISDMVLRFHKLFSDIADEKDANRLAYDATEAVSYLFGLPAAEPARILRPAKKAKKLPPFRRKGRPGRTTVR